MSVVTLAVALARRRFVAVVLLGGVGYRLALLFFLYGAPDLALTQVLVETLMIVVFMLVLRRLPERHTPVPSWAPWAWRIGIATAVGIGMAGFALVAGTVRTDRPVTDEMAARSVPEAGGHNLVNVIIVDFRGFDTMGEITVLALAAIGVANLVRAARRAEGSADVDPIDVDPPAVGARSAIFDTVARMAFHLTLVLSVGEIGRATPWPCSAVVASGMQPLPGQVWPAPARSSLSTSTPPRSSRPGVRATHTRRCL